MVRALPTIVMISLLAFGCGRSETSATGPTSRPTKTIVDFSPITQLPLKRTAHVAVDLVGNVYSTSESERGQDGVIVVGENGIPRATQLSSGNILSALGESAGGNGTIQDLATDPEGGILFYFSGGKGRTVRVCVGRYVLRTESIKILFDTAQLMSASGMSESITLARGSFVPMGTQMYLLLRHSDAWGLFSFDLKSPAAGDPPRKLRRVLEKIRLDEVDVNLSRQRHELATGPAGKLLLMDRESGVLWQVDPTTGKGSVRLYLAGLPRELSPPLVVKEDHLLIFAADSEPIASDVTDLSRPRIPHTSYPAILEVTGNEFSSISRDDFRAPSGFPAYALRIRQLYSAPDGSFVGVDLNSGQLMRIRYVSIPVR